MRILVVGWGSIAQRHVRNVSVVFGEAQFIVLKRSAAAIDTLPRATIVNDIDSAIACAPDVAIVANPSALHIDVLPALLRAGIVSYVEKPVVTSREQIDIIKKAIKEGPRVAHLVGFNLRLLGSLHKVRAAIVSGQLGQIIRANFSAGQWLPDWRPTQDYKQSYSANRELGGGVLFDLCHELDAARWLLGDIDLRCCCTAESSSLAIEAESAAIVLGRSHAGVLVSFDLDYVARRPVRRYEIIGDKGSVVWDLPNQTAFVERPEGRLLLTDTADDFAVAETYRKAMRALLEPSEDFASNSLPTLEDGLASTFLAVRAHELGQEACQ
jgi:predicted dehydrogenase